MRLRLGFAKPEASAGGAPPAPTVEDILSGSGGFALDFSDTSRMWTDQAKTTLVTTTGETIAVARTKWGAAEYDFTQATSSARPPWQSPNAADFDSATSDHLSGANAAALLQAKPAGFACAKVLIDSLAAAAPVFSLSTNSGTSARFRLNAATDGSLALTIRRVDGGSQTAASSATGVVTTGVPYVITMTCDYNGTRAIVVRVNGTEVISTTLVETAGLVSNTATNTFWVGRAIGTTNYLDGRISRMVFGDKLFTSDEIATIEAWVGQGALT